MGICGITCCIQLCLHGSIRLGNKISLNSQCFWIVWLLFFIFLDKISRLCQPYAVPLSDFQSRCTIQCWNAVTFRSFLLPSDQIIHIISYYLSSIPILPERNVYVLVCMSWLCRTPHISHMYRHWLVNGHLSVNYPVWSVTDKHETRNPCWRSIATKRAQLTRYEGKWNESGFRPSLSTYRLNWAWRISWGWWDDWDDTVLQTQNSKFELWRSEAEHATSRSRRLPTILTFTRGWERNIFCFFQTAETGIRTPNSGLKGSGANHYPRAPAHDMK